MKKLILLFALMGSLFASAANEHQIEARFDSVAMLMGDQCNLSFEFEQHKNAQVLQPVFSDTIIKGLDIVKHHIDTLVQKNDLYKIRTNYLVTSYDTTLLYVPKQLFIIDGDSSYSNPVSLKVLGFPVDTTQAIADIVTVVNPPIDWNHIAWICLIILFSLALIYLIYRLIKWYRLKQKPGEEEPEIVDLRSASEIAFEHLNRIEEESIWKEGAVKQYYSEIIEVLKMYMQQRFEMSTLDKTSDEVLELLHKVESLIKEPVMLKSIARLFKTSDLVKFAKYIPDVTDHQNALVQARDFIKSTLLEMQENPDDNDVEDIPESNQETLDQSSVVEMEVNVDNADIENSPYAPK